MTLQSLADTGGISGGLTERVLKALAEAEEERLKDIKRRGR